jgi:hypothetical protein
MQRSISRPTAASHSKSQQIKQITPSSAPNRAARRSRVGRNNGRQFSAALIEGYYLTEAPRAVSFDGFERARDRRPPFGSGAGSARWAMGGGRWAGSCTKYKPRQERKKRSWSVAGCLLMIMHVSQSNPGNQVAPGRFGELDANPFERSRPCHSNLFSSPKSNLAAAAPTTLLSGLKRPPAHVAPPSMSLSLVAALRRFSCYFLSSSTLLEACSFL